MIIGINASKAAAENKTGIEWTVYELILALKEIDKKNAYRLYTNQPLPKELLSDNFQEVLIPFPKFWHRTRLPIELLRDNIDAYIEPSAELPTFSPKKSLVFIHDLAWFEFPQAYSRKEYIKQRSALKKAVANAKTIACISKSTQADLWAYSAKSKPKTVVIPLGFNPKETKVGNSALPEKAHLPYIFYVGRLEERKNIETLIKAFDVFNKRNHGKYSLLLAGKPGFGYQKIESGIRKSEFANKIFELGYIDQNEKISLLKKATIFAFVSRYEGFGLPILEAFNAGVPVVTANISSLPEVAGDAALLANPDKPAEIAEAFARIISDPALAKKLVTAGKERVKQFTWENTAKAVIKCLEEM